jgi:hypothetical protein
MSDVQREASLQSLHNNHMFMRFHEKRNEHAVDDLNK